MAISPGWQVSYVRSLFCHSWQIKTERSVSAMFLLLALLALVLWAVIATVVELRRDGYRQTPTDWSRVGEPRAHDRAESGHIYR